MKHALPRALLGLFVGSGLVMACAVAIMAGPPERDRVYAVGTIERHLRADPAHWAGLMMLVRGEIVPCLAMPSAENGHCAALAPNPWQPPSPTPWRPAIDPLPLVRAGPDPLLAYLRRVPFLDAMLPSPQVLRWGAVATYRVRLRASVNSICGSGVCYEAVLLDAMP